MIPTLAKHRRLTASGGHPLVVQFSVRVIPCVRLPRQRPKLSAPPAKRVATRAQCPGALQRVASQAARSWLTHYSVPVSSPSGKAARWVAAHIQKFSSTDIPRTHAKSLGNPHDRTDGRSQTLDYASEESNLQNPRRWARAYYHALPPGLQEKPLQLFLRCLCFLLFNPIRSSGFHRAGAVKFGVDCFSAHVQSSRRNR